MADADRLRWNERFAESSPTAAPSEWVHNHEALIRPPRAPARALDLACGLGQNSIYLAELGYRVDAWDISDIALERLRLQVGELDITARQVDLDVSAIPSATYDLVLDVNFLERRLLERMSEALRPGGLLLMRALMRRATDDDRTAAYLLEPGELRRAFPHLHVTEYEEDSAAGWAAIVARRSALTEAL